MALFRRKRPKHARGSRPAPGGTGTPAPDPQQAEPAWPAPGGTGQAAPPAGAGQAGRPAGDDVKVLGGHTAAELGPFDSAAVPRPPGFLDLGSLWLPNVPGVTLMVETDPATSAVTGLRVQMHQSTLQLQVFAAPKSQQLWDDIRADIVRGLAEGGGSSREANGPYGPELIATVPARTPAGAPATSVMRFLGVDGPRWFLRAVLSGPAATSDVLAKPFIDLLRVVVVHRGDGPMAPRELLPMHMPRSIEAASPAADQLEQDLQLKPFERGPEITEIR